MSFILDALKKSENQRQEVTPAEFASVPSSPAESRTPAWLWLLGALLVINAIVLVGFMTRSPAPESVAASPAPPGGAVSGSAETRAPGPAAIPAGETRPAADTTFADRVAQARTDRQPVTGAPAIENAPEPAESAQPAAPAPVEQSPAPAAEPSDTFLPSIDELRMQGALTLPDLHIDIHVYSEAPADRFVFINMNKYRESDQLSEGPVVREITRNGVVLEHRGNAFVLPRE